MLALYGLLAVVVAGVLFLIAAYVLPAGEQVAPPLRDEPVWELPASRGLDAADIESVRLPVALRGYRFAETDLLLDRLADELKARDLEIARLRGTPATAGEGADGDGVGADTREETGATEAGADEADAADAEADEIGRHAAEPTPDATEDDDRA